MVEASSVPFREETWQEKVNKRAAILIHGVVKQVIPTLARLVTSVVKFILDLIPEALGKN